MHSPTENHWSAVKQILRYLQGTVDYGLFIKHDSETLLHAYTDFAFNVVNAFSDVDWAGCPDDRRCMGGFAIYLGSNLLSWSARKHIIVSQSSPKSEYKALAHTVVELTWLQALLQKLRIPTKSVPTLWCDNLGTTYLSTNLVFHALILFERR
ncbi:putative RNA-directed DNA polymerase [Helianthus annuus]|nr:putative RNA-directed DNA polymerase [Helianthus annuus]